MESPGSSLSLSPVPSPHAPYHDNITISTIPCNKPSSASELASQNAKNTTTPATTNTTPKPPEKIKKPRKKREPVPDDGKPKEKKPRKPRTSNPDGASAHKKQKVTGAGPKSTQSQATGRQPTLSDMMNPQPQRSSLAASAAPATKAEPLAPPPAPAPRPFSSGQRYDPIRGLIDEPAPPPPPPRTVTPSSPQILRHSSPPSLAHLMHPSASSDVARPVLTSSRVGTTSAAGPSPHATGTTGQPGAPGRTVPDGSAMDLDRPTTHPTPKSHARPLEDEAVPKPASIAPIPKERKSPPRISGSGLLSSSDLLGGIGASDDGKSRHGVDISIEIKLNPAGGNTINIAQEIMRKYGRDAINPRAAAHRERLLQVAAAANKLEVSGDEMSVDGESDRGDDSTADMIVDGQSTAGEGADGDKPRKKRRRKAEDYDKEDDFIDDTEMAWEESAAVAKDGFFVYSGPLVKPEEKTETERATTSTRGRGRGRGSRGGRGGAGATHASSAARAADGSASSTNGTSGRGRGGRGRGAANGTRKPRVPKDEPGTRVTTENKGAPVTQARPQEAVSRAVPVPAAI